MVLLACTLCLYITPVQAQIKKPKIKLNKNKLLKGILGEDEAEKPKEADKTATGKKKMSSEMEPIDVNANISDASRFYDSKQYGESRFAIQQAIVGIEVEIGHKVLDALPGTVQGMGFSQDDDQVVSTGMGFVGLLISRRYEEGGNFIATQIANNAAMVSAANLYISNPAYASQGDTNVKVVRVNGERAVVELTSNDHFKISMPFGQSSIIMMDCNYCETEKVAIAALEQVDMVKVKSYLGEQ